MSRRTDAMLLYRIARYYYVDMLSQSEIASIENISRSQISRLLSRALEQGVVRISVELPEQLNSTELAGALKKGLGLWDVVVAAVPEHSRAEQDETDLATVAASVLPEMLRGYRTVGLGWGRTMYQASLQLSYRNMEEGLTYVPLIGITSAVSPDLQISIIVDRFAEKHRTRSYFMSVPVLREKSIPMPETDRHRYAKLKQYWSRLDAAVIGLGGPPRAGELRYTEVSPEYERAVEQSGAVGDILAQYFLPDGSVYDFPSDYQQIAFDIKRLHEVNKTICIAGGKHKVPAIMVAAQQGFFNILITDAATAKAIFDILYERGQI